MLRKINPKISSNDIDIIHQALKKELKRLQKFAGEYSTLEDARQRHQTARGRLPEIENHLNRIQVTLENQEYAQTTWKELQDLQKRQQNR